jgi:hypothetical protein
MGRPTRGVEGSHEEASAPDGAELLELVQTRVSTDAHVRIRKRAKAAGLSKSAWVRVTLYRALGLSKG